MITERLLRLPTGCPACGTPPRVKITAAEKDLHAGSPPDQVALTYQCHKRREGGRTCNTLYPVPARAYQLAG